jgi:hypothetical protein
MTGQIVELHIKGRGEIRSPSFFKRVPFDGGALVNLPIGEALGAAVAFDVVHEGRGHRAVRVRRAEASTELRASEAVMRSDDRKRGFFGGDQ